LSGNIDEDGYVVFITTPYSAYNGFTEKEKRARKDKRLVGFSNGIIKRFNMTKLETGHSFRLPMAPKEKLTCGVFSENKSNFACGTNQGTLIIGSINPIGQKSVDATFCRLENVGKFNMFERKDKAMMNMDLNEGD